MTATAMDMEKTENTPGAFNLGGPHLIVSPSPHFHSAQDVTAIMRWVLIALLPSCAAGVYFFGLPALRVLAICLGASLLFEYLCARIMKRGSELRDLSAAVTGVLLGMNLPSGTPWWICVIGAFFAVVVGKMIYGGIGCNPFNPALVGRVALLIAFPAAMTAWPLPDGGRSQAQAAQKPCAVTSSTPRADDGSGVEGKYAITCATPLKYSKAASGSHQADRLMADTPWTQCRQVKATASRAAHYWQLLLGIGKGGSLGETCALALLLGGILLAFLNIIRWQIPLFYLLTVFAITGIAHLASPTDYADPLFHLLTGGLMLGAFFMATDMVTTPLSRTGAIIFAVGCGIITAAIRLKGSYPEGVSFSILIMNAFTPLIDRFTAGKPFGMPKKKGILNP